MNDGLSDGIVSAITEFKTGADDPSVLHVCYYSTPERKSKSPLLQAKITRFKIQNLKIQDPNKSQNSISKNDSYRGPPTGTNTPPPRADEYSTSTPLRLGSITMSTLRESLRPRIHLSEATSLNLQRHAYAQNQDFSDF